MKRILFLSSTSPANIGGTRRLWYNLLHFSRHFEVHFIKVDVGMAEGGRQLPLPKKVKAAHVKADGFALDLLAFLTPLTALHRLRLCSAQGQVQKYIDEKRIDAVVAYTQDCSFAFRNVKAGIKVSELLDSHRLYYSSKRAASGRIFEKAFCHVMELFASALEMAYGGAYDMAVYVSHLDKAQSRVGAGKIGIYQDVRDGPLPKPNLGNRKTDVVIFGRWQHPPNRDGLGRLLPELGRINGSVKIVGPGFDARGKALPKNVSVEGYVDDIDALMSDSKVCIIPVWYGAGLQNKVFDALRFGCVVVTTEFTGEEFSANGMGSDSIVASSDVVGAASQVLANWSGKDAGAACKAYKSLYLKSLADEKKYLRHVKGLVEKAQGSPSP